MRVVTAEQMQGLDRRCIDECGIPGVVLMENAGLGATEALLRYFPELTREMIAILAGRGNNGGDGFVIARHLKNWGFNVKVYLLGNKDQVHGDALVNLRIWEHMGGDTLELPHHDTFEKATEELRRASLIVDAVLGTGVNSDVKGYLKEVFSFVNGLPTPVMAVDIPSGLNASTGKPMGISVKADCTVTFGLPKIGQVVYPGVHYTGSLEVVDIGIPRRFIEEAGIRCHVIDREVLNLAWLAPRPAESHKGNFGHLAVLAGSAGKTGAASMVCEGALRIGAGLVTLGIPATLNPIVEVKLTEAMTEPLPDENRGYFSSEALEPILGLLEGKGALAMGPGISTKGEIPALVEQVLAKAAVPMVIDADGLNALEGRTHILKQRRALTVLTPHPGEMARLTGMTVQQIQNDRIGAAAGLAVGTGCTVVLKGSRTVIVSPEGETFINPTGNPGMASGGTGDVLTGMIGGFLAQGFTALEAAMWGVYLHGTAADIAVELVGESSLVAGDIVAHIPHAIRAVKEWRKSEHV